MSTDQLRLVTYCDNINWPVAHKLTIITINIVSPVHVRLSLHIESVIHTRNVIMFNFIVYFEYLQVQLENTTDGIGEFYLLHNIGLKFHPSVHISEFHMETDLNCHILDPIVILFTEEVENFHTF